MNHEPDLSDSLNESDLETLNRLWLESLSPVPPPPERALGMRRRLLARAARSAAASAAFRTIRARDGAWSEVRRGVRAKPLWSGPAGHSVLLEFAPGASLPVHRHRYAEEGIVLSGGLQTDGLDLGVGDYHYSPPGSRHGRIFSRQGALAYLRGTSLGDTPGVLRELLGGLLPWRGEDSLTVYAADPEGWIERAPGVSLKPLRSDGSLASYFCRVEAGAELEGHDHREDEECLMIEGELFLGDLLLRAGDYQLAPAGSRHGRISSDPGALLFVRGQAG